LGKDHTIFSLVDGIVRFGKKKNGRTFISVDPKK
jgi:ribosomal protein L27